MAEQSDDRRKVSKPIVCPHTRFIINVPAHFLTGPRTRGDMRQYLEAKGYTR